VATERESMNRQDELRIQALGAAISRRDWHAVEQAHAAIRDKFYAPDHTGTFDEEVEKFARENRCTLEIARDSLAYRRSLKPAAPPCEGDGT
jgi:hypothetical protein